MSNTAETAPEPKTADMTIDAFLDALAARQSTPGGGGAAALTGAQAAALLSMVINFTIGNKRYADVEAVMREHLTTSTELRHHLTTLADRDIEAFNAVAACYTMPRSTDAEKAERTAAMQTALKGATRVPFQIAEACLDVLRLAEPVGAQGNRNVVSDAATALYLAHAALHSALVNVNINLKLIKDADFINEWSARRNALQTDAEMTYQRAVAACEQTLEISL